MDKYGYSIDSPPDSCMECEWHGFTVSPETKCHTYWSDYCKNINKHFAKLHIILRGEYRNLSNHTEAVLKDNLPFECPYFDSFRVFWESYGRIKYDYETFADLCNMYGRDYIGYWVYSLKPNIDYIIENVPKVLQLHYIYVDQKDMSWFLSEFGTRIVVVSAISPYDWVYPVPE